MKRIKQGRLAAAVVAVPAVVFPLALSQHTFAGLMLDTAPYSGYQSRSVPYDGEALWIEVKNNTTGTLSYDSAVRINYQYAVTAAHVLNVNGTSYTPIAIGEGANHNTPSLSVGVASTLTNPGYNPTFSGTFNSNDVAIIQFASPLAGTDATLGSMQPGQVYTTVGYGQHGTPSTGNLGDDGFRTAFDGPNIIHISSSFDSSLFTGLEFAPANVTGLQYGGNGLPGNSGSGVFNSATGELDGIADGNFGGTGAAGTEIVYNLGADNGWVLQNTQVPEPASITLLAGSAAGLLLRRRRSVAEVA